MCQIAHSLVQCPRTVENTNESSYKEDKKNQAHRLINPLDWSKKNFQKALWSSLSLLVGIGDRDRVLDLLLLELL